MEPITLLSIFAAIWALTHFWVVPLLQSGWQAKNLREKIAQVGLLAASEKLRDATGVAFITLILVVFLVWLFSYFAGFDQSVGQSVVRVLSNLYQIVSDFTKSWATFVIWVGGLGSAVALYLVALNAKSRVVEVWTARAQQVFDKINQDPSYLLEYGDDPDLSELIERVTGLLVLLSEMGDSEGYEAERQQLGEELSQLFSLCAMEIAHKELDLEEVLSTNQKLEPQDQPSLLARVLSSKQFSADLNLVNRPLSMLVTVLLVISLIGWTSEPLANSMRLAVNNLRVHLIQADLERELQVAINTAQVYEEKVADDELASLDSTQRVARVSQQVARISLQQMMRSGVLERSAGAQLAKSSPSEFVRAAILQQQIQSPKGSAERLRSAASERIGPRFNEPEEALRQIESDLTPKLEALDRRNPKLLTQLSQRVAQRYGTPMGALDAQGNLIAKIVGQSLSPSVGGLNNELAKQGVDLAKEIGEKAVGKWANTYANSIITEALVGQARAEVFENMKAFRFGLTSDSENLVRQVVSSSGRGWSPTGAEVADHKISNKVAQYVANYAPEMERATIIRNLGGYSELFPSAAQSVGEGLAQTVGKGAAPQSMSTNFRMASRSFRVRGVLFGQDLEADEFNITRLWWNFQDDGEISLSVEDADSIYDLGSFDAGILNQALRYAADQRVIATTITPGDRHVIERVTYLHPVLSDTPLGCRIVEADRFIDTFTFDRSGAPVDPRLQDVANHRQAIGRWIRFANIAETITHSQRDCPVAQIQEVVGDGVVIPSKLAVRIREFVRTELVGEASSDFIEKTLVCAEGDPANSGLCLCNVFSGYDLSSRYWFPEDHTSQFRERGDRLDTEFKFVAMSGGALEHVDLWLHTTFAVRNWYDGAADESTAKALDFSSDQLKRVSMILKAAKIPAYIEENLHMSADEFIVPVEQFLVMQRFLRAALNNQLGERFPLGRLIELERVTRQFVEYQPTIRWEPVSRNRAQFLQAMSDAGEEALSQFTNHYKDQVYRFENNLPLCGPSFVQAE